MELKLTRLREPRYKLNDRTIGRLFVDGKKYCNTIEDVERFPTVWQSAKQLLGIKVYGKTAIPTGKYEVTVTYSGRFKRMLPLLIGVPEYTAIRIHSGNKPEDTEVCILVGKFNAKDNTVYGGKTLNIESDLTAMILKAIKTQKVFITIE